MDDLPVKPYRPPGAQLQAILAGGWLPAAQPPKAAEAAPAVQQEIPASASAINLDVLEALALSWTRRRAWGWHAKSFCRTF